MATALQGNEAHLGCLLVSIPITALPGIHILNLRSMGTVRRNKFLDNTHTKKVKGIN